MVAFYSDYYLLLFLYIFFPPPLFFFFFGGGGGGWVPLVHPQKEGYTYFEMLTGRYQVFRVRLGMLPLYTNRGLGV